MSHCSYGNIVSAGATVRYVFETSGCERASTVCGGWLSDTRGTIDRPSAPPSAEARANARDGAQDPECVGVPPGGRWVSTPTTPPPGAFAYLIRIDFGREADAGTLTVYANDQEVAREPVGGCDGGVAMWTFDLN